MSEDIIESQPPDEDTVDSQPPDEGENVLLQKYQEAVAEQSALMDRLAQQLITLELAIPGLYATVLKLTQGEKATITADFWFYAALVCWLAALALAVTSIIPRDYDVDPTILESDPDGNRSAMSIKDFFRESAIYKRKLLIPSIVLFWLGIISAIFVTV